MRKTGQPFFCGILTVMFVLLLMAGWTAAPLSAQNPKTLLFQDADKAKKDADDAEAFRYSPGQYETAEKKYEEADDGFKKGKNLEDLKKKIEMSRVYYLKAIETTNQFKNNFSNCVRARSDALNVDAPAFRPEGWKEAEEALEKAAKTLEDGNLNSAKSKATKAEELYRKVELEAIKANYLDKTRELLTEGKKSDVKKKAPKTLEYAEELAGKAEKQLVENRYDTDEARQLAQEARYQAELAKSITWTIKSWEDEKKTMEDIILDSNVPVQKISDALDLNARFHNGIDEPTDAVLRKIRRMQQTIASLEQDVSDRDEQIEALTTTVKALESQVGDLKTKEESLAQLMEQQRIWREKYQQVEQTFTVQEAQVLRSKEDVIVRLYGLSFPVGKSTIQPEYFSLLKKVVEAFQLYPQATITVEGHTDSRGSDAANQKLSTARADAVREYLLASGNIEPSLVRSTGYGETKPIASNDMEDGRRKNRRIDVVIHPQK
ncbi:OmpA family protein [bacterium]|nr:OmpA family protein [bacterium]